MIRNILCHIDGISLYGVISIGIFFTFFIGMLVWAFGLKNNYLTKMGGLPLDSGERPHQSNENIQS